VLGGQDHGVIDPDVVNGDARDRPVQRQDGHSAGGELFPLGAVDPAGGVHHAPLHGAVPFDPGHDDPHQASLPPPHTGQRSPSPTISKRADNYRSHSDQRARHPETNRRAP